MKRKKVLLIEDYPVHQMLEESALREDGREVVVASDDDEAFRELEEKVKLDPENWLIVLDLRLLGEVLAGVRILEYLEQHASEKIKESPVLIASANSKKKTKGYLQSRNLKDREILEKPFDMKSFMDEVIKVEREK